MFTAGTTRRANGFPPNLANMDCTSARRKMSSPSSSSLPLVLLLGLLLARPIASVFVDVVFVPVVSLLRANEVYSPRWKPCGGVVDTTQSSAAMLPCAIRTSLLNLSKSTFVPDACACGVVSDDRLLDDVAVVVAVAVVAAVAVVVDDVVLSAGGLRRGNG